MELIKSRHSHINYKILELDRLRLKHIVVPRSQNSFFSWDSASTEVSYESALGLFEADLEYLLSGDLSDRLPTGSATARVQVLDWIRAACLHNRFGKGSKVSLEQYGRLIEVTQAGWVSHLRELGVRIGSEPVYELGESNWTSNSLVENEVDLEPLDEECVE